MTMINPTVLKAVHELLQERGIEQRQDETLGDYIARGLGISAAQTERLLEELDKGCTIEQAEQAAGVTLTPEHRNLAESIARSVGTALGRVSALVTG